MEQHFYTLHQFLLHTKGAAYILMAVAVVGVLGFWLYITGRDEETFIK